MKKNAQKSFPHFGVIAVLAAGACLSACVVQERVYSPPPPRPYSPPPPPAPAYDEPSGEVEVRATQPPPPLPDYEQPPCPEEGYLWTPGYWSWSGSDYYWVPGTWVQPPRVGVLWTPGYWAFMGGVYGWHAGYWGPHVGFYGGVNYGYGYVGVGYVGGRWDGNRYAYNRSVNNVNTTVIHNTYNQTVVNNVTVNNVTVNRVSYNGGSGGVAAAPTAQERVALREPHVAPTPVQREHVQEATRNPALAAAVNGGRPAIAATPRPAAFNAPGVVGARGAGVIPPRAPMATAQPQSFEGRPGQPGGAPETGRMPPPAAGQPNAAPSAARTPPAAAAQPNVAPNAARPQAQPAYGARRPAAYGGRPAGQPQPASQGRPAGQPGAQPPAQQRPQQRKPAPENRKGERDRDRDR
jgi:hypothetical protein